MSSAAVAEEEEEYYEGEEGEGVEGEGEGEGGEDPDEILRQMDDEYAGMEEKSAEVEGKLKSASSSLDENSIYVGQVDYEASAEELMAHFSPCGAVNRVTIMRDHITGMPKGFAYIEFADKEALNNALKLDDTLFKGRQLKILPKMKKVTADRGRGRGGYRGRGGGIRGRGGGGATKDNKWTRTLTHENPLDDLKTYTCTLYSNTHTHTGGYRGRGGYRGGGRGGGYRGGGRGGRGGRGGYY